MYYARNYRPLGEPPAIPGAAANVDTYHAQDDTVAGWIGTALSSWIKGAQSVSGGVFQGIGQGIAQGLGVSEGTVLLIGAGVLVYLLMGKKGRR